MQLIKILSLIPLAMSVAAMPNPGGYGQNRDLAIRESEPEADMF